MPSFFELKAEQEKLFKEMNKPQEETSTTINDVVAPTHKMEPPKIERPIETTNYSGLQGAVNRALSPEEQPQEQKSEDIVSDAYYTQQTPAEPIAPAPQPVQPQTIYTQPKPVEAPHNYFTNDVGNQVLRDNAQQQVNPQPVQPTYQHENQTFEIIADHFPPAVISEPVVVVDDAHAVLDVMRCIMPVTTPRSTSRWPSREAVCRSASRAAWAYSSSCT